MTANTALAPIPYSPDLAPIIALVTDAVGSDNTRRAYGRALADFLTWRDAQGRPALSRALVQSYARLLLDAGAAPASINQRLSAIRKLAAEAADNDLIDQTTAQAIQRVHGVKQEGRRLGNWLTLPQAQAMVNAPDTTTIKGLRDRAILAVLIGCGLRRAELARLELRHIQQRAGRWVIVDLVGKRRRVRSVPMPAWVKAAIDAWTTAAALTGGLVLRPVTKGGRVLDAPLTTQAVFYVVTGYAAEMDLDLAPHDLRRTYAKLAHQNGAALEQIQITLGHASIQTTERYLGVDLDLERGAGDYIPIRLT